MYQVNTLANMIGDRDQSRKDNSLNKYKPTSYKPPTPANWRKMHTGSRIFIYGENKNGLTGLKCHGIGQAYTGEVMVKDRPRNVGANEVLIPLR